MDTGRIHELYTSYTETKKQLRRWYKPEIMINWFYIFRIQWLKKLRVNSAGTGGILKWLELQWNKTIEALCKDA